MPVSYILLQAQSQADNTGLKPVLILVVAILFIITAIVQFRVHAFLALITVSFLVAILTSGDMQAMLVNIQLVSTKFGETAGNIGLVIALASIIGMCLTESGAADSIVNRFLGIFGERGAGWALLASGFVLSIPVFLDTVFFLLIPLARVLGMRTRKDYLLYLLALGGGGAITHSMVPPTPGPLMTGNILGLDLGATIVAGTLAGLLPAVAALYFAKRMNTLRPIEVRPIEGTGAEVLPQHAGRLPSFAISILPVLLPVLLIAAASFLGMASRANVPVNPALLAIMNLLGEKVIALGLGTLIAVGLLVRRNKLTWASFAQKCGGPLELAGVIILITAAGGSFGAMIANTGVGGVISHAAETFHISYILLAWLITAIIRVAQGSGTVSMITGAGLMAAVLAGLDARGESLGYNPLYIYIGVGFGSIICSWMNDSAFWIFSKLSGLTERETLRSWTVMLTFISIVGLIETMLLAMILPLT